MDQVCLVHSPCHPPSSLFDREPVLPGSPTPASCCQDKVCRTRGCYLVQLGWKKGCNPQAKGMAWLDALRSGPMLGLPVGSFSSPGQEWAR